MDQVNEAVPAEIADDMMFSAENPEKVIGESEPEKKKTTRRKKTNLKSVSARKINDNEPVEGDPEQNQEILDRVAANADQIDDKVWELGKDLMLVKSRRLYKQAEYKTWPEYCRDVVRKEAREAYWYIQIYQYFCIALKDVLRDQPELYEQYLSHGKKMGWTKAKEIAVNGPKIITADNADEVLKLLTGPGETKYPTVKEVTAICSNLQRKSIEEEVANDPEKSQDMVPEQRITQSFSMTLPQKEDLDKAMEMALKISTKEKVGKSTLLSFICQDYIATNRGQSGDAVELPDLLSRLERLAGVDIIALDTETKETKYGSDYVQHIK